MRKPCANIASFGLLGPCLLQNLVDKLGIVLVLLSIAERLADFLVVDELLRVQGFGVVLYHNKLLPFFGADCS